MVGNLRLHFLVFLFLKFSLFFALFSLPLVLLRLLTSAFFVGSHFFLSLLIDIRVRELLALSGDFFWRAVLDILKVGAELNISVLLHKVLILLEVGHAFC